MTLPNNNLSFNSEQIFCTHDSSSTWDPLYNSEIWSNSHLRQSIINAPLTEKTEIKYCYTCRGKVRNYQLNSSRSFVPEKHSTPKENLFLKKETYKRGSDMNYLDLTDRAKNSSQHDFPTTDVSVNGIEISQPIPTISNKIDKNYLNKFINTEYNIQPYRGGRKRLRKSLKGLRCIINFALTDSPKKKRTQIQACSISLMILAIVVISLILVNFTSPNFLNSLNDTSTNVVPTHDLEINRTTSAIVKLNPSEATNQRIEMTPVTTKATLFPTSTYVNTTKTLTNIRKNIKTYLKSVNKDQSSKKSNIINRDLSQKFCSCQKDEICMLNETSGTSICLPAVDKDDPTGCGGLCALETEACHLVDRSHGARVCRQINPVTCSPNHWRCRNGLCVPSKFKCDGLIQCYDKSDELNCECDLKSHFRCGELLSCFPNNKICDGFVDCWDGHDELNCTKECPKNLFTCNDSQCIPSVRFCDGVMDCDDGSDEPSGCGSCGIHEIRCNNKRCISSTLRCNGHNDCEDNTDELDCS